MDKSVNAEIKKYFSDEYIENLGILLYSQAEAFIGKKEISEYVYINEAIYQMFLIDMLVDLERLKDFHDIDRINYAKLMAYAASWWIKRKPIQLKEGCPEKYIYTNEEFARTLLIHAAGCMESDIWIKAASLEEIEKTLDHILYHLKFRNTNPQTLELLVVGFQGGMELLKL